MERGALSVYGGWESSRPLPSGASLSDGSPVFHIFLYSRSSFFVFFFLSCMVNMEEVTLFLISQIIDISFEERLFKLTDADLLENFPTPEGNFCSPCFMFSCWDGYWVIDQPFSTALTRPFLNPPLIGISIWITKHIVVFLLFSFFGPTLLTVISGRPKLQTKRYLGSGVGMVGGNGEHNWVYVSQPPIWTQLHL